MKKIMNKIFVLAVLILSAAACNEDYQSKFDDYDDFIRWRTTSGTLNESATTDYVLTVQLVGEHRNSSLPVSYTLTANNAVEGVDYSFPNGEELQIDANSSTGTLVIRAVNNDIISEAARSLVFTLNSENEISLSTAQGGAKVFTLTLLDDDFWCPRNILSEQIAYENDFGYSSKAVSIAVSETPEGCLYLTITGGTLTNFSFPGGDVQYGPLELVEDTPESNTGTIKPGTFKVVRASNPTSQWSSGGPISVRILEGGTYDLETGTIVVDYEMLINDVVQWPGTFIYSANSTDWDQ